MDGDEVGADGDVATKEREEGESVKRVSQGKKYWLWAKVRVKVWVKVNVMTSKVDVTM